MKHIAIFFLRAWKTCISPVLGRRCRFEPTCSEYGIQAVERHGIIKGGYFTMRRLLRCHPLCEPGYDPVPEVSPATYSNSHPALPANAVDKLKILR